MDPKIKLDPIKMEDVMGSDRSTTPKTAAKTDSNDIIMDA